MDMEAQFKNRARLHRAGGSERGEQRGGFRCQESFIEEKRVLKDGQWHGEMLCGVLEPHVPEFKSWPHHLLAV